MVHLRWNVDLRSHWAVCSHGSMADQSWWNQPTEQNSKTQTWNCQEITRYVWTKICSPQQRWLFSSICRKQKISLSEHISSFNSRNTVYGSRPGRVRTLTWCLWELGVIYIFHWFKWASWQIIRWNLSHKGNAFRKKWREDKKLVT